MPRRLQRAPAHAAISAVVPMSGRLLLRCSDGIKPYLPKVDRRCLIGARWADETFRSVVLPCVGIRQDGAGAALLDDADILVRRVAKEVDLLGCPAVEVLREHVQLNPAVIEPRE